MYTMFTETLPKITDVKRIVRNEAFYGTAIVTAGVFTASIFGYLLQFLLGRMLSVPDYGTFNALLALANIAGVPGTVLSTSLTKIISEIKAQDGVHKLTSLFWKMSLATFAFSLIVSFIIIVFQVSISKGLNISDPTLLLPFAMYLGASFMVIIPLAFLQGLLKFNHFSFANVFNGFIRFAVPIVLVILGYKVHGVFYGIFVAFIFMYMVNTFLLRGDFKFSSDEPFSPYIKRILIFSLPVLLVNFGMMLLNNVDLILVKKFFSATEAGYYAGAVTVGKVLLFGAGTVVIPMFPQISSAYLKGENYMRKFGSFLAVQLVLVLGGLAVFTLFPGVITHVMFGEKFMPSVQYIPLFSVFIALYVLVNFFVMFYLALGETRIFLFQVPAAIVQFLLLLAFHRSLYEVIWINIIVCLAILTSLLFYLRIRLKPAPTKF